MNSHLWSQLNNLYLRACTVHEHVHFNKGQVQKKLQHPPASPNILHCSLYHSRDVVGVCIVNELKHCARLGVECSDVRTCIVNEHSSSTRTHLIPRAKSQEPSTFSCHRPIPTNKQFPTSSLPRSKGLVRYEASHPAVQA